MLAGVRAGGSLRCGIAGRRGEFRCRDMRKLIKGGRYSADVAIGAAVGKHIDHLPLARQSRMAKRQGALITR